MNTPVELGYINGAVTANSYDAGVLMLSTTPAPGDFSAIANVEITFK
ncbi:hypothetical protein AAIK55_003274 [Acinetobacter baumannii]